MTTFSSNPQIVLADQFDMTALLADMGLNENGSVPMAYSGSAAWKNGGRMVMGNRPNGDNLPSTWVADYDEITYPTEYSYCLNNWWTGCNAWFVTYPGSNNTTTNAGIKFRNAEIYAKYTGQSGWTRLNPESLPTLRSVAYFDVTTFTNLPTTADPIFLPSEGNLPVFSHVASPADRSAASAVAAKYRAMHTRLTEYTNFDAANLEALMVTFEAKIVSIDGLAFNGVTEILVHAGADYQPLYTDSVGTGKLIGATYKPAAFNSRFRVLDTADEWVRLYGSTYLHADTNATLGTTYTNVAADFTNNPIAHQY